MGNEVSCACDGFRESRVEIGKVDPLRVLDDLIAVENVKEEARHASKRIPPADSCGPAWKAPRCRLTLWHRSRTITGATA